MATANPSQSQEPEPRTISTSYGMELEEVIEYLRAANTLGLGIIIQNRWRPVSDDGPRMTGEWVVTILDDAPTVIDDDA
jgi:hypothetical protein